MAKPIREQTKLLLRYRRTRSRELRDQLIEAYLPLVESVARRVFVARRTGLDLDDLVGIGVLGLVDSLRRFDPDRGVAFSVFAGTRIRGAIMDECRKLNSAKRAARALVANGDFDRPPGLDPSATGGILDGLIDPRSRGSIDAFERREMIGYLTETLTARERRLLMLYYGRGATMREVADRMGLSVPRISALHASILGRLHQRLREMKHEVLS